MFYDNDIISRQIAALVQIASKVLFNKNCVNYEKNGEDTDELYDRINELLEEHEFGEGEDLLYENFDIDNDGILVMTIDYYHRLNEYDDDTLDDADFTRDEVKEGLMEFMKNCGIPEDAMTV